MRLLKELYISEDLHRQAPQIIEDLKNGRFTENVYLVTSDPQKDGLIEMLHIALLHQKELRERIPLVIGLASSKSAGIEMIGSIITTVLNETGGTDYKSYFASKEQIIGRGF